MNPGDRQMAREAFRRLTPPVRAQASDLIDDVRRKLRARLFDKQYAFLDDSAKKKAALCTRRAGKTTETAVDELDGALDAPGAECLYGAITRERAKDLLWPELHRINHELSLGMKPNEVELTMTLPEQLGRGRVKLFGADKPKEIQKRRGGKYRRVRLDEAQLFGPYLKEFVNDVLEPALMDLEGDLGLLGTPAVVCAGMFYDVTRNETPYSVTQRTPGWSVHSWSVLDNPFVPHAARWLEEKRKEHGWTDDNPTYLREWCGRWVNDSGALFYRYDPAYNSFHELPEEDWQWVFGVDLGYDDAFAFHGWAFSRTSPILYGGVSFKRSGLTPTQWFELLLEVNQRYRPRCFMVDTGGLGRAIVEDGKKRYPQLPLRAAVKTDKAGAVAMLNADLVAGTIKIKPDGPLAREWAELPKDPDDPLSEDPRFANHISDAALYAHREARHYLGAIPKAPPAHGTPEFFAAEEAKVKESILRNMQRQTASHHGDDDAPDFSNEGDFDFDGF